MRRAALGLWVLAQAGCLPADTRPEPGSIVVTIEPSEGTRGGFESSDGWTVKIDRALTAMGSVDLDGDPDGDEESCNAYSDARYDWTLDLLAAKGDKLGLVYGLGRCSVEFRLRAPSDDTVLGAGVTADDVALLRSEGSDAYAQDQRVSLQVRGSAERGGERFTFEWSFRRSYELDSCADASGDGYSSVLDLEGGAQRELSVVASVEELFRVAPTDDAPIELDLFMAADADESGDVTLEELATVAAPPQQEWVVVEEGEEDPFEEEGVPETLADLVYVYNLPRIPRVKGGGPCEADLRDRR
ncbi:MAG: hypothetical protein IPG04_31845 [Polyangiaceae bacterium]|nr:hypothetical protein [Polyangiaceae bacterium]